MGDLLNGGPLGRAVMDRIADRVRQHATTALHAAQRRDTAATVKAVEEIAKDGWTGCEYALRLWTDTLLGTVGILPGSPAAMSLRPAFLEVETGDVTLDPAEVTPARAWAGRMIVARAQNDHDGWHRILTEIPTEDQAEAGDYVLAILHAAANTANGHGGVTDHPPAPREHDHEHCLTGEGVAPGCPNYGEDEDEDRDTRPCGHRGFGPCECNGNDQPPAED